MTRILVRAPNWIGDQVLALPFFYFLRRAYPRAHIASVCVPWVADLQFRDLVNEVHVLPRAFTGKISEKFRNLEETAAELKKKGPWDLGISLPNSISAAWLLFRSGVKQRRGYRVDGRGFLLNDGLNWDGSPDRHRAQAYLELLPVEHRRGIDVRDFWEKEAENELDPPIPGILKNFNSNLAWPEFEDLEGPREPYWVLAPGATAESRRWPSEYFIHLARKIHSETGWKGVIVGGPKEAVLAAELTTVSGAGLVDLTAQGPVPSLVRLFQGSKFTVCNESGLAHIAALSGSFVQIVCGAADPKRTRPLGPGRVQVAINPVECWPCERNTCFQPPANQIQCLRGISPDSVWEEIQRGIRLGRKTTQPSES